MRFPLRATLCCALLSLLPLCALSQRRLPNVASNDAPDTTQDSKPQPAKADALDAAQRVLGSHAEIIRYGELNQPGLTEAVAVVARGPMSAAGLPITDLAVLQFRDGAWKVALSTDKYGAKNKNGYIGVVFLNDSIVRASFHLKILQRASGTTRFTLVLTSDGKDGGLGSRGSLPVVIGWNAKVGRYEALDERGAKFQPEVANPPSLKAERAK